MNQQEIEAAILRHLSANPTAPYTRQVICDVVRVRDTEIVKLALEALVARGQLDQRRIRMKDHWQAHVTIADRIARRREQFQDKPLKGYENMLLGHMQRAIACGGRA